MELNFIRSEVEKLIQHSKGSKKWNSLYEQPETAVPGLWLVGDQGVYLMSNGNPHLKKHYEIESEAGSFVAYAQECDPSKEFDEWWENKRESFGGDDGCDFIEAKNVDQWLDESLGGHLVMDLTPVGYQLIGRATKYLPGALKKSMTEKRYTIYLQQGATAEWKDSSLILLEKDGTPFREMKRASLLKIINHLYKRLKPGASKGDVACNGIPISDMDEHDLIVVAMILSNKIEGKTNDKSKRKLHASVHDGHDGTSPGLGPESPS